MRKTKVRPSQVGSCVGLRGSSVEFGKDDEDVEDDVELDDEPTPPDNASEAVYFAFLQGLRFWYFACSRLLRLRASAFAASVWYSSIFSVVNNGV
jgi:hypothetical protein